MVNEDLTRYPEVGCPWGARTGEPRAKAGERYCEPGMGSHNKKAPFYCEGPPPIPLRRRVPPITHRLSPYLTGVSFTSVGLNLGS